MKKKILLSLTVVLFAQSAFAIVMNRRKFVRDVVSEVQNIDAAIMDVERLHPDNGDLNNMWVRMQFSRGIAALPIISLTVVPEVELHLKRKAKK